ncbi:short-chain fatty acyl-CoA regulator family protein [Glycomyces sp. NPDC046736]|uniref:short-chain fatty acyl-CoA regulator family protein n=1 Tax=Glycomyces sp. NPDC046736 TaxID=3155615 RepID=UPI0034085A54
MALKNAKVGLRLRRFREEQGLTQAALAAALGISTSYVNQMESNQRPLTGPVLLRLAEVYDLDVQRFSTSESDRLTAQLLDALADTVHADRVAAGEARELAEGMPQLAQYVVDLHRRYRHALERNTAMSAELDSGSAPTAHEEVRDLFYAKRNHVAGLDRAAEDTAAGLDPTDLAASLTRHLRERHGTTVADLAPGEGARTKRRFEPDTRVLRLSPLLSPGQRAFQLATHLALVAHGDLIDAEVAAADLSGPEAEGLARIGLANYFAGALILPYGPFLGAAEALRYDIDLLQRRFGVGFETVAHRLSTLQRPGARGVPFFFVRVDRAGNISKRQSATDFHFSRVGGSCPLWNVYDAFSHPGEIRTQLAQMPDGRSYLWVARTVARRYGGYGTPTKTFAIGLGCDLHHAHRLVYGDGLDLAGPAVLTPIGPGCKVCDRTECPQRAFPAIGRPLDVDDHASRFTPYPSAAEPDTRLCENRSVHIGQPLVRGFRALVFALACTAVSAGLHAFADGSLIPAPALAAAAFALTPAAYLLAGTQRGTGTLLAACAAAQTGLHVWFTATAGHLHDFLPSAPMLAAHLVAMAASALWLARGDAALAAFLDFLILRFGPALWLRLHKTTGPAAPRPAPVPFRGPRPHLTLLACAATRRGPPARSLSPVS